MDNTQRAGGYIRVENENGRKDSAEKQRQVIESFARSRGINLLEFYIDSANSADLPGEREGYKKLNNDIVSGRINTIITNDLYKFTDDDRERQGLMHNFAEKGVEIFLASTGDYINPSDPLTKEQRLLAEAMRNMEDEKAKAANNKSRDAGKIH
ncbi:MAG: recombinase family protein [Clostridia bacterium]|nr:recombinase family protein [Clostridia bacterium]